MAWDRVYTINGWYDGVRLGVADVYGVPHIYESRFDSSLQDFSDAYLVSPIKQELLDLVLEDWAIWKRWRDAFDRGAVSQETHPALPEDRSRHEQIKSQIDGKLVIDDTDCQKFYATFRHNKPGWDDVEVEWSQREDSLKS